MGKKVLGLLASPRKGGNSEMLLKEALLAGDGWDKEIIRLHDLDIQPCRACYRCIPKGNSCVIKDNFNQLMEKIRSADGIILSSPVYILGPIAVLKNVMDRFISVGTDAEQTAGKPALVLTTYGIKNWQGLGREYNNLFTRILALDLKDSLIFHSPYPGQVILENQARQQIQAAAANLFNPSFRKGAEPNCCPTCWNPFLSLKKTGQAWCPICGREGKLTTLADNGFAVDFPPTELNRFAAAELYHHFGPTVQHTMKEFMENREKVKKLQAEYRQYEWDIKLGQNE